MPTALCDQVPALLPELRLWQAYGDDRVLVTCADLAVLARSERPARLVLDGQGYPEQRAACRAQDLAP